MSQTRKDIWETCNICDDEIVPTWPFQPCDGCDLKLTLQTKWGDYRHFTIWESKHLPPPYWFEI